MRKTAFAAALALILVTPAVGQNVTGNQLDNLCKGDGAARAVAAAYVVGSADTMAIAQDAGWVERKMCLRSEATAEQMTDIVCHFLMATPQFRDFSGPAIVSMALNQAFPCQ